MRKNSLAILFLLLSTTFIVLTGCPGKNNPTSPSGSNPTNTPTGPANTPTVTSTPNPNIYWLASVYRTMTNGTLSSTFAGVYLLVNGTPTSAATIVLNGTNLSAPVTLAYIGNYSSSGTLYALFSTSSFTYQVGATYSLTSITSAGTASQTLTAPGNISVNSAGTTATWTGGSNNAVQVFNSGSALTYSDSSSVVPPFSIPQSAYPASDTYDVRVNAANIANSIVNGSGSLDVYEQDNQSVTIVLNTPTPTNTPTSTPTSTPTLTFTPTFTFTPTPNTNIYWEEALVFSQLSNGVTAGPGTATLALQVNGAAVSTAGVTLSGTGVASPVALSYAGASTLSGQVYGSYLSGAFTYRAGKTYILTSVTSAGTASQTLTAPGAATLSPDGSQLTWLGGGNSSIVVTNSSLVQTYNYSNASSPFSIPASAYPASDTYNVGVEPYSNTNIIANGSGFYQIDEIYNQSVTLTVYSPTPTNTPTISYTPTLTFTTTFTLTPTSTVTSTITQTPTQTTTDTLTATPTATCTNTITNTPTNSPSNTPSFTPTNTPKIWHLMGTAGTSVGSASYVSLSIDPSDGTQYVGYADSNSSRAELVSYNGSSWGNVLYNLGSSTAQYVWVAASTNLDPNVDMAFYDSAPEVAYYNNSTSTSGTLASTAFALAGGETIFKDGTTLYMALFDVSTKKGWVLSNSGSSWTTVGGGPFYTNCGAILSLYVDTGTHTPYIAFTDLTTNQVSVEMVSTLGSWVNVGSSGFTTAFTGFLGAGLSLYAFGGNIYLALMNTSYQGVVWQYSSSTWSLLGGSPFSSAASYVSLALYGGNLYVGFSDQNNGSGPSVMVYSGGSWNYLGLPGFTGSSCTYTSLAVSNAIPYLAFSDGAHGGKLSVYENY